jgi:hypothetical protein
MAASEVELDIRILVGGDDLPAARAPDHLHGGADVAPVRLAGD